MRFTITLQRRHILLASITFAILATTQLVISTHCPPSGPCAPFPPLSEPSHALDHVTTTASSRISVDSNHDGIIDEAANAINLGGQSASSYCRVNAQGCPRIAFEDCVNGPEFSRSGFSCDTAGTGRVVADIVSNGDDLGGGDYAICCRMVLRPP